MSLRTYLSPLSSLQESLDGCYAAHKEKITGKHVIERSIREKAVILQAVT